MAGDLPDPTCGGTPTAFDGGEVGAAGVVPLLAVLHDPPGGVLELDETFEAGVRREVQEETGVDVEVERLTDVYQNLPRGIVALVFRCHPRTAAAAAAATDTAEATRIGWLTVDEITANMDPAYATRVTDALAEGPAIRVHDGVHLIRPRSRNGTTYSSDRRIV